MAADNVTPIEGDNWQSEVLEADIPVLVDFWAEWCGPCRAITPIVEELAAELQGKLKVAKVNVDDNQALASEFGIRSIPTLLLFKDGAVQEQMVGAMGKAALKEKIDQHLA